MSELLPCGRPLPRRQGPPSARRLDEAQKRLRVYLAENNLKYTEPRWTIARFVLETGGHLDASSFVTEVGRRYPAIGPATVYRTIKLLCSAGILVATHQDIEGRVVYEMPHDEHHDHIICLDCGQVCEFHDEKIESLQAEIARREHFELASHRHVIHARCEYLRASGAKKRKKPSPSAASRG